ncbi:hypothetical protein T05_5778 [Trichinella murrelli]|uniref:Uncharacterized protein n=1 Tax=Trichinella murrelli TaxID=144512 RepID=A0A0V0UF97_9BILA|nr:hypothetical protein T05_5778 [Trichinella murrelli]
MNIMSNIMKRNDEIYYVSIYTLRITTCLKVQVRLQTWLSTASARHIQYSKTIGITSSADFLWCSFCSGLRDKSCSHHFVLNLASQTSVSIEFAPDCSWIVHCGLRHPMKLVPFATRVRMDVMAFPTGPSVHLLITFTKKEFNIFYDRNEIC